MSTQPGNCFKDNILEFRVKNSVLLQGLQLGFEFSCTAGNQFTWVENYGNITPNFSPVENVIKVHDSAFVDHNPWVATMPRCYRYPDSLLLGGTWFPGEGLIDIHPTETTLYSMQIRLPNDESLIGEEFCIDNVFLPPAAHWIFTDNSGMSVVPHFDYQPNTSGGIPDAPPVCFPIIGDPTCEYDRSSVEQDTRFSRRGDSTLKRDWPQVSTPEYDSTDFVKNRRGEILLSVEIKTNGNGDDLRQLVLMYIKVV